MQAQQQQSSSFVRFFREAHRRRVFRVAALYVVGAWLVLQVADVTFPAFGIADAALRALLIAALLGFPVALVFGWIFDIGRHGIRRTAPAAVGELRAAAELRRGDYLLLIAFLAVAGVIVYNAARDVMQTPVAAPEAQASGFDFEPLPQLPNSIAVLPFTNLSDDPANEFFSDGISEEILHRLGAFSELKVIGRTSSFAFKGSQFPAPRLSALLGAQYLLQGSVRKAGDQVRVSAQLLDAAGLQVWSERFDRELTDIFAIQSGIADAVATQVAPQVRPQPALQELPDIEAYERYLAGRELLHQRHSDRAREALQQAIELDPDFAEAHAELAIALLISFPDDKRIHAAQQSIDTALSLQPGLLRAQAAQGLLLGWRRPPDHAAAETVLRRVLAQDPTMNDVLVWLSGTLSAQGLQEEADIVTERGVRMDPLHPALAVNWAQALERRGEAARAEQVVMRLLASPQSTAAYPYGFLQNRYLRSGRLIDMHRIAKRQALDLAAIHYWALALSHALFGDWQAAEYWINRSQKEFPEHWGVPFMGASTPGWQGKYGQAQEIFEAELALRQLQLDQLNPVISLWLGEYQALSGDFDAAIATLGPALGAKPGPMPLLVHGSQALAWAHSQKGNAAAAAAILSDLDQAFRELEQQGRLRLGGPGWAGLYEEAPYLYALNTLLMGENELALDRLEAAIENGWRNYYIHHHDPRWDPLRDDPHFQSLMASVKADVDAQHREVKRMESTEDFIAKLDAALAARAEVAGSE
jgi:TolB-like protein